MLSFSPSIFYRNLCHQEHYHLKKHSTTQLKPMQVGWFSSMEEESKWLICLVFLSIHYLLQLQSLLAHPRQQMLSNRLLTPLIFPFPILLKASIHLESSYLCRCKVWEGTSSPCEVRKEGKMVAQHARVVTDKRNKYFKKIQRAIQHIQTDRYGWEKRIELIFSPSSIYTINL